MSDLKVQILDSKGKVKESVAKFDVLNDFDIKYDLLSEVIRAELSNARTSNAHSRIRSEVRGGGKKPWKQKGTGRARHGSIRSPIWKGGGVTFGPRNTTNWHLKINKSARLAALKSLMKDRLLEETVYELSKVKVEKTKNAAEWLESFVKNLEDKKVKSAIVYTTEDKQDMIGFKNTGISLINVGNIKINKLANAHNFIFTAAASEKMNEKLNKVSRKKETVKEVK